MKCDLKLIYQILTTIEALPTQNDLIDEGIIDFKFDSHVKYQFYLLESGEMIDVKKSSHGGFHYSHNLTWKGCEYLAQMRFNRGELQ